MKPETTDIIEVKDAKCPRCGPDMPDGKPLVVCDECLKEGKLQDAIQTCEAERLKVIPEEEYDDLFFAPLHPCNNAKNCIDSPDGAGCACTGCEEFLALKARAEKAEADSAGFECGLHSANNTIAELEDMVTSLKSALAAYQTGEPSEEQIEAAYRAYLVRMGHSITLMAENFEGAFKRGKDVWEAVARAVLSCPPSTEYVAVKREDAETFCKCQCFLTGDNCLFCPIGLALKGGNDEGS